MKLVNNTLGNLQNSYFLEHVGINSDIFDVVYDFLYMEISGRITSEVVVEVLLALKK